MTAWFTDGTVFAVILALTLAEAAGLILWHQRTGRGLGVLDVIFQLAAGACLLLAAWLALRGANAGFVGLSLAAAGVAHLLDLRRRLKR